MWDNNVPHHTVEEGPMNSPEKPAESGVTDVPAKTILSLVKADIRRGTATSIGVRVEEMLEGAERKVHEARGAKKAMQIQTKNLMSISAAVDGEIEKSIPDIETLKIVKLWVSRCVEATDNFAGNLANVELQAAGEVAAYKAIHDHIQDVVSKIDANKVAVAEAIKSGTAELDEDGEPQMVDAGGRPPGVRPSMSVVQQRKAEEQAEEQKQEEVSPKKGKRGKR
jgi:hypothetical protein